tara:strand:+ start:379 stop:687 length:309 start_codon:yes stop_codon:yes gene_type:complete
MSIKGHDFLEEFASLCDKYQATLSYSKNDDGISIELNYEQVFCGWLYDNPSDELRDKIKENTTSKEGVKCYRVFDHEDEGLFRYTYVKPDLDCKIEEFYEYE